jgi:hypothetical protein
MPGFWRTLTATVHGSGGTTNDRARCRWHRDRFQAVVTPRAYTHAMDEWKNPNEDARGVDVGQIRAQLDLTVAERVREMVHAANVLMTMQENARRFREMQPR